MNQLATKLADPKVRLYIYNVTKALLPVLVVYGLIMESNTALFLALAGAILGFGALELASLNTPVDGAGEALAEAEVVTEAGLQETTAVTYNDDHDQNTGDDAAGTDGAALKG